ncbi:MAG: AAA family ATPase [Solirubrobacteraceae bacterium]
MAIVVLLVAFVQVILASEPHPTGQRIKFSTFVSLADTGGVKSATILDQDSYVEGTYQRPGGPLVHFNTPYLKSASNSRDSLVTILTSNQVPLTIDQQYGKSLVPVLAVLLPALILIIVIAYWIYAYRSGNGLFATRSGARRAGREESLSSFADVAAQDGAVAELQELAQFLSDPKRFTQLGARIPKGVLLYGPPGCGKTLLARALAGESGAAFYSISGSDFVELYVGVGASRVRELFNEARENAPAIVFIDELDAVGRKRRSGPAASEGSSEEQGQALNQILTEMDGFSPAAGTIVVGATNRPDDLDQALLRPGRFDRAISVDRPDEAGRAAILAIHGKNKPLADGVDLSPLASRAIGLTGADLESVMNEAALLAARADKTEISQTELDGALTRVLEAPERQRRLSARDRTIGQQSLGAERVTFGDVAGSQEALGELSEIKDFLSDPSRFTQIGARFPRGFLLVGPPGCGKTLLARAVAGESNAAFLSVAATEFTEIYIGEGSGRVRDLFAQARAMAPSIVFIDEIDAVGARREASLDGHREREQTLNQILIELDGFRQRDGVIVMAATNRPEILDAALVRAGRFDRTITLDLPDRDARKAILAVHSIGKTVGPDVDIDAVAGITRGLSGADLANVMNEAALLSARRGRKEISMATVEEAVERTTMGISRAHVVTDEERRVIAFHEAGHAVVARSVPEGRLPHMISIIPSGRSLGGVWITDSHDRLIYSRSGLIDEMAILLGGRSAEKLIFGHAGSGAVDDLAGVGQLAHRMVRELGMSDEVGAIGYPEGADTNGHPVTYSEHTARLIDTEARKLVDEAERRADAVLETSRPALERIAQALLESETLSSERIETLAAEPARAPAPV